jgi:hypothetical protein
MTRGVGLMVVARTVLLDFLLMGRGRPLLISTQYELPILMPLQSFLSLGIFAEVSLRLHPQLNKVTYVVQELLVCYTPPILEILALHGTVENRVPV